METIVSAQQKSLLEKMFSLSGACPFDGENPCKCPFHEIRKKDLENRLEWARSMSDDEIVSLFTHHLACLEEKQAAAAPKNP
jgi:hypothetical protein